jgi:hypothetical protein
MIIAFLIGALTAFFFTPLALVPFSVAFIVAELLLADEITFRGIGIWLLSILLMNAGYLVGALVFRWLNRNSRRGTLMA